MYMYVQQQQQEEEQAAAQPARTRATRETPTRNASTRALLLLPAYASTTVLVYEALSY
jgi:hypothetical protein